MMKNNKLLIIFSFIVIFISIIINIFLYENNLTILAPHNSYGIKYAKQHNINNIEISDSKINDYMLKIEEFEYKETNGEIEITGYNGISRELIIPNFIDNKKVTKINNSLFNENIDSIVISKNIKNFNFETNKKIKCYDNKLCENYDNIEILNKSYNFEYENNFEYNIVKNEIEITNYYSKNDILIIPETINGYKVTGINFDINNLYEIYLPNTISKIESSNINLQIIMLHILIFIIVVITSNFNKIKNLTDKIYNMPYIILTIIYLILDLILIFLFRALFITSNFLYVIMSIASIIYIFLSTLFKISVLKSKEYDKKMENINNFKNVISDILLDNNDTNIEKIKEEIKYSEPISIEETKDIEKEIIELVNKYKKEKNNNIANDIIDKIKIRNEIIKNKKR